MENPLISIIIPIKNRESWLPETLDSLLAQTYSPLEVVLVDNCSSDRSQDLCKRFRLDHHSASFSVLVLSEKDGGANGARNTGFKASHGEFVLFFDSDDLLFPDSISRMVSCLNVADAPDVLVFPFELAIPNGRKAKRPHRFSADPVSQLIDPVLVTHNMCIRRRLVEQVGLWDETLSRWQDLEFGFRILLSADSIGWIKGRTFHQVRVHEATISGSSFTADHDLVDRTLEKIHTRIGAVEDKLLKNRLQRALCFKRSVLAGILWQEGERVLSKRQLSKALYDLPSIRKWVYEPLIRSNFTYMKCRGRGFWRLADLVL